MGALSSAAAVHNMMSKDSPTFHVDEMLVHEVIQLKHLQGLILVGCVWSDNNHSKRSQVDG